MPSLTDSTVVLAMPPMSPPHHTFGSDVAMVSGSISGIPHLLNLTGDIASMTRGREGGMEGGGGREKGQVSTSWSSC